MSSDARVHECVICGDKFETILPQTKACPAPKDCRNELRRRRVRGEDVAEEPIVVSVPHAFTEGEGEGEGEEGKVREPTAEEQDLARRLQTARTAGATARFEATSAKRQLAVAQAERDDAQSAFELATTAREQPSPNWLVAEPDEQEHRATLLALFSDFHVGEVVEPKEMNGYNAYNPKIAELRLKKFFDKVIELPDRYLAGVEYDGIVVPSLGDTISGDIHEEFRETNGLTNFEAVPFVFPLLRAGLERLADRYGKVHYVGVPGNHPRDSRKPQYKKRSAHNADTMISKLLAVQFEDDDRFTFNIPDGISADFQVYGTRFRAEHGDEAKGGSGIQGAMSPLAIRTHRIRKQAQAEGSPFDVLLLGHWHQYMSLPSKGFIVNGAGKGYDEYARGKGFEPEPPQQGLLVVTPQHGIGLQMPVFVADREAEGW